MTASPRSHRRPRRPRFTPEVPDILLAFAAIVLLPQALSGNPSGSALYAGSGILGLWITMRTEWKRNRRNDDDEDDRRSSNGAS